MARLPAGRRRAELAEAIDALVHEDFRGRVEPFDAGAAKHYALVVIERDRLGRPVAAADAQIASVCRKLGAKLATRNIKDFDDTGVELVDPFGR